MEIKSYEKAMDYIIDHEYSICMDDHDHIKHLIYLVHIKDTSVKDILAYANTIKLQNELGVNTTDYSEEE